MSIRLVELEGEFRRGHILDRPNRFVLEVEFEDGTTEPVYISNTGSWNVTKSGRPIIARAAQSADRKTEYDALFVKADTVWVSIDATFPNRSVRLALEHDALPLFQGYQILEAEPSLPSGGRADFSLQGPEGQAVMLEVKSCTVVEEGIAKFPDRPTARGRRHLEELMTLQEGGTETHVMFVVQREDGTRFEPNATVDPEFASLLIEASTAGVGVHAMQLRIDPNAIYLEHPELPVHLPEKGP